MASSDDDAYRPALRHLYRGELPDDPNGNEHTLTIYATYAAVDGLTVTCSDSTQWPSDDLEYTYHISPMHIGHLLTALGAVGGDDLLDLLAQRYEDGSMPTPLPDSWLKTDEIGCCTAKATSAPIPTG